MIFIQCITLLFLAVSGKIPTGFLIKAVRRYPSIL